MPLEQKAYVLLNKSKRANFGGVRYYIYLPPILHLHLLLREQVKQVN